MADEMAQLQSENTLLKTNNKNLEEQIRQMEDQLLILKSSVAPLDEESKKAFEGRLNQYLRTINKCIALLKT